MKRRLEAERGAETLAAERAEAETRAAAILQSRLAAEEALAEKARDSAEAEEVAAAAARGRQSGEKRLRALIASRLRERLGRAALWTVLAILAAAAGGYVVVTREDVRTPLAPAAEPLQLRLERSLFSLP